MSSLIRIAQKDEKIGFGLSADKKNLELVLPHFYKNTPNQGETQTLFDYYQLFKKYKLDSNSNKSVKESEDNFKQYLILQDRENKDFSIIEAYFTLFDDFQKNKLLLFQRRTRNLIVKGRISWTKTLQKHRELVQSDSVMFQQTYYDNLQFDLRHDITILYACTIQKIASLLKQRVDLPYSMHFLNSFENNITHIRSALRLSEKEMFSDRERKVFAILKQLYLTPHHFRHLHEKGNTMLYAPNMDYLWERMLKTVLQDESADKSLRIIKGKYNISNSLIDWSGLSLIPDILVQHNDHLLIIDAKNYQPNWLENKGMPATESISKQILYKLLLSNLFFENKKHSLNQIINIFLLPADFSHEEKKVQFLGKHDFVEQSKVNNLGAILCFQVDFESLKNEYLNGGNELREELFLQITERHSSFL